MKKMNKEKLRKLSFYLSTFFQKISKSKKQKKKWKDRIHYIQTSTVKALLIVKDFDWPCYIQVYAGHILMQKQKNKIRSQLVAGTLIGFR